MTPSDLEARLREIADELWPQGMEPVPGVEYEATAKKVCDLMREAADYIAQVTAKRDRLREALENIIYEIQVHEQEDGLPGVECSGAGFHLTKVEQRAAAALEQTGEKKDA